MTDQEFITRKKSKSDASKGEKATYQRHRVVATTKRSVVNPRRASAVAPSQANHKHDSITSSMPSTPFPVPAAVPTPWLVKTSVMVLVKHLLYVRGLLPMSVEQLFSYDVTQQHIPQQTTKDRSNKLSPSMRRCIRNAQHQIQQLFQEWQGLFDNDNQSQISNLDFILISLGPSYNQSQELYLLDIQSLHCLDKSSPAEMREKENDNPEKLQRLEATLTRRLLSSMMNQEGSPLQQIASKASPSFRLWLTLGISGNEPNSHKPVSATTKTTSPVDFLIPRSRFPLSSTRKRKPGSMGVTIRLRRPSHRTDNDDDPAGRQNALSDHLLWRSLPTCVKGFRMHG